MHEQQNTGSNSHILSPVEMTPLLNYFSIFRSGTASKIYVPARQIGNMNECVIETGKNVCHSENYLSFPDLWAKGHLNLFLLDFSLPWCHYGLSWKYMKTKHSM
jgi:hypothetical protein